MAPLTIYKKSSNDKYRTTVRINALGDSITFGVGSNTDPEDTLNIKGTFRPYHKCWAEEYDAQVTNCGESGSCVAKYDVKKGYQPNFARPFVVRAAEMPVGADMVTILGGVNDCQSGYFPDYEFGSPTDPLNTDINTFCGALRTTIKIIKERCPDALIVYLTPLKYSDKPINGIIPAWRFQPLLPYYIDAIEKVCNEFDVYVLDCYSPEELDFANNEDDKEVYGDRLHVGWKGHERLSKFIINNLSDAGLIEIKD